MPCKPSRNKRFIDQARSAYVGNPKWIARYMDRYDEEHVVIKMVTHRGQVYHLDWIGAERAKHPDEFGPDAPFPNLNWSYIADLAVYVPDTKET